MSIPKYDTPEWDKYMAKERAMLEERHGQVWTTSEMERDFDAISFMAPYCTVVRREDGAKGSLEFQARPRFYYGFRRSRI